MGGAGKRVRGGAGREEGQRRQGRGAVHAGRVRAVREGLDFEG